MSSWWGRKQARARPVGDAEAATADGPGSVSAETITGIVSTGSGAVNVQYQAEHAVVLPAEAFTPPEAVAAPAGLVHLPVRPQVFEGRERELRRLDAAFDTAGTVVVHAVHGLGGIGKSTLAARWADRRRDTYSPVWWIAADSAEALDAGLVAFAAALQPGAAVLLPSAVLRERAVQWLASHQGWLLILDNVGEPAGIAGLLARLPHGRIVVTSRRATGWPDTIIPVRLDVLDQAEAVAMLTGVLTRAGRQIDEADAAAVCTDLGCLPLAIEQAAAYLAQTGVTARDYRRLLAQYPARMFAEGAEGRRAEQTVARVWQITLEALADDPLPGAVLRVLAWCGPEALPRHVLNTLRSEPEMTAALGRLAAYHMVEITEAAIVTHRLVQAVTRTPDPGDPHRQPADIAHAYTAVMAALLSAAPREWQDPASWPQWRTLIPHIDAAAGDPVRGLPDDGRRLRAALLNRAGLFVGSQGNTAMAIRFHEQALADHLRVLGALDPNTLVSLNNLANVYQDAGDGTRAVTLYEHALAGHRHVLGDDHPNTLHLVNNLAYAHHQAGDLPRATPLFEQALADRRRILGDDHPDTLTSVNNLANAYHKAGDLDRAIPLLEQSLADHRRVLGDDHPSTVRSVNNLAAAYRTAGGQVR